MIYLLRIQEVKIKYNQGHYTLYIFLLNWICKNVRSNRTRIITKISNYNYCNQLGYFSTILQNMLTKWRFSTFFIEFISILHSRYVFCHQAQNKINCHPSGFWLLLNEQFETFVWEENLHWISDQMELDGQMRQLKLGTNKCNYFSLSSQTSSRIIWLFLTLSGLWTHIERQR